MPVSKCRVRSICWSCNRRISGPAVVVVTTVKEDDHQPRAYLVHEGCQSAMLLDCRSTPNPSEQQEQADAAPATTVAKRKRHRTPRIPAPRGPREASSAAGGEFAPGPPQALSVNPAHEFGHVRKHCGTPRDPEAATPPACHNVARDGTNSRASRPCRPRTGKCPPAGPEGLSVAPTQECGLLHQPRW